MATTAAEYLKLIAPQFNVRANWFSLSTALITGNVISCTVNGQTAIETYASSSDETLDALVLKITALPVVSTVVRSGLVITVTTVRDEILLSAAVTLGASQAVITIGPISLEPQASFLTLATLQTHTKWYQVKYEYAVALRAAHLLTLDAQQAQQLNPDGTANPSIGNGSITNLKQGDLALAFGAISENTPGASRAAVKADLSRTIHGVTLLGLKYPANFTMMSTGSIGL
jgi:hypothetical protein